MLDKNTDWNKPCTSKVYGTPFYLAHNGRKRVIPLKEGKNKGNKCNPKGMEMTDRIVESALKAAGEI